MLPFLCYYNVSPRADLPYNHLATRLRTRRSLGRLWFVLSAVDQLLPHLEIHLARSCAHVTVERGFSWQSAAPDTAC